MNSIDTFIESRMEAAGIVGIGAAIIVDKKLVWTKGYGYADKDMKIPFTPNTIMNIASISKTFTGVCLMLAIEDNKVSLDEDINKYLPFKVINPYFPNEKITLRNLSTHTSSLVDRYPFYDSTYCYGGDSPESLGAFLKNYFVPDGKYYTRDNFLDKKPGAYREYSNIAAGLAGYIVEIVTGQQLNEYSKKNIFKPLKMKNTGWFLSEINWGKHSKLYDNKGDSLKNIPLYSVATYPDGGVRTSVKELSRFYIALLNGGIYNGRRILKRESVDEMQKFQFTAFNKPENVNLNKLNAGIFWATKQGATLIGHAGSDPGVKTEMLSDLAKDVGVILFTNTSLSEEDLIKYHFGIFDELYKYGAKLKAEINSSR
ncbi:MAG: beta-lactamase family protein [Saprospiraceae bacterium]|nr:beta-lactamase family protein [Saprospiraceae bacterium]